MRYTAPSILILGLLLTSCGIFSSNSQESISSVEFRTLLKSFQTETQMHESETVVLVNNTGVNAFLSQFPTDSANEERLRNVNFSDSLVIGVFVGAKPNTSYSVNIDSVLVSPQSSFVYITETGSAAGFRAITWPAHFVVAAKADFDPRNAGFPYKRICLLEPCAWPVRTEPATY